MPLVSFSVLLIFMYSMTFRRQYIVGILTFMVPIRAIEPILFPTALDFFYHPNLFLFQRYAPVC